MIQYKNLTNYLCIHKFFTPHHKTLSIAFKGHICLLHYGSFKKNVSQKCFITLKEE